MWTLLLGCPSPNPEPVPHTNVTHGTDSTSSDPTTDGVTADSGSSTTSTGVVKLGSLVFDDALPRNLLVISLDTTRRDYLGYFNGGSDTPNLDAFLQSAYVLENHRSCSNWTAWSMTCVVSGRNPMENGFATWSWTYGQVPTYPPPSYETLPRRLTNELGMYTVLVTANSVFSSDTGVSEGFGKEVRVDWTPAENVADSAIAEAKAAVEQPDPWYLHVHFIDPHGDYCPPEGYYDLSGIPDIGITAGEVCYYSYDDAPNFWYEDRPFQEAYVDELQELYRGELRYWDTQFGEFMDRLENTGALDDTLVVFVTDHGQQFYERDDEGYGGHGHGIFLGSEENRSTAAFWAANLHPGTWDGLTLHQDITRTLYTMFGIEPFTPITGLLVGTGTPDRVVRGENFWSYDTLLSVTQGTHQLVYDWWGDKYFYRLEDDEYGLDNVYDPNDPDVIALWPEMSAWVDDVQYYWGFLGEPGDEGP